MENFQTRFFAGDFAEQREQFMAAEKDMNAQGFATAWQHVRTEGMFVVFFREKK
jgi:hypothetical protein